MEQGYGIWHNEKGGNMPTFKPSYIIKVI